MSITGTHIVGDRAAVTHHPHTESLDVGQVRRVSGPVIEVIDLPRARLLDVVRVGTEELPGEVIRLDQGRVTVQVFEDTTGLRVGDPVANTGQPLTVELGPGLLGGVFDGTQRPLTRLYEEHGHYIPRGSDPSRLDRDRVWEFVPTARVGARVGPGDELGHVMETERFRHRILVPHDHRGTVEWLASGPLTVEAVVAVVGGKDVSMLQRWPARLARPVAGHRPLTTPLLTGQRVLDVLFPVAQGGTAIIPGGFGTGKTVLEQAIAKFASVDVVVYVGCGERGNELTEVLEEFPQLVDPRTGGSLMGRTVLVANTSNMPVAAREASVYVGMTIAEYYRDQGHHAVLLADSTSRWGEALREVSSRLEEIPAEDGYPAYLATRLAGFYERAGSVDCLGSPNRQGSVTVVGAVSPAGGDFSEPVTQNSLRVSGCFWGLDAQLARARHFPSINWTRSYTTYRLDPWYDEQVDPAWSSLRAWSVATLQEEGSLQEVVALLGLEAMAAPQRVTLRVGRMLREDFLQQSSFDEIDASCPPNKQVAMLQVIHAAHQAMTKALERGDEVSAVVDHPVLRQISDLRTWPTDSPSRERAQEAIARLGSALGAPTTEESDDHNDQPDQPDQRTTGELKEHP